MNEEKRPLTDQELYNKLLTLALDISNMKADISVETGNIVGFTAVQSSIERKYLAQVSAEKTDDGKAAFKNQESRDFAAESRYRDDVDWMMVHSKVKEAADKKRRMEADLERVERIFDIMRIEFKRRAKDTQYIVIKDGAQ